MTDEEKIKELITELVKRVQDREPCEEPKCCDELKKEIEDLKKEIKRLDHIIFDLRFNARLRGYEPSHGRRYWKEVHDYMEEK